MDDPRNIYAQPDEGLELREVHEDELTITSQEAWMKLQAQIRAAQESGIRPDGIPTGERKVRRGDVVKVKGMPGTVEVQGVVTINGEEFILVPVNAAGSVRPLGFTKDEIELVS